MTREADVPGCPPPWLPWLCTLDFPAEAILLCILQASQRECGFFRPFILHKRRALWLRQLWLREIWQGVGAPHTIPYRSPGRHA